MLTFIAVVIVLFLIPGPAVMLTLARSLSGGRRVGILTGAGIAIGDLIHTMTSALGLSAVLMTSALAFEIVKYLGAGYLFYLGVRAFIEKSQGLTMPTIQQINSKQVFKQGLLTELLNPKTALFFLSFLPQFVQPNSTPVVVQLLTLGLTFVLMSILYTTLLAFLAGTLGSWLTRHQGASHWQGKVVGAIYIGLGFQMALQQRT